MKAKRKTAAVKESNTGWYIIDQAHGNRFVRGPYKHREKARAVRKELERAWNDHDGDRPDTRNLWIVGCKSDADYQSLLKAAKAKQ